MTDRPNPLALAETLRALAGCWLELDKELMRVNGKSSREAARSKPPLAVDVLDAKRAIDNFAHLYARILMDESTWVPAVTNAPYLLEQLAMHIGHFTHNPDALVAYEFAEDLDKVSRGAWAVANPNGIAFIPIGPCFAEGCTGKVRVMIDRDSPADEASLALWRPTAVCDKDNTHRIDAKLYQANTPDEALVDK